MSASLNAIFQTKYDEFAASLTEAFPELTEVVKMALAISPAERTTMYKSLVLPGAGSPKRESTAPPGMVLPGVYINDELWNSC